MDYAMKNFNQISPQNMNLHALEDQFYVNTDKIIMFIPSILGTNKCVVQELNHARNVRGLSH